MSYNLTLFRAPGGADPEEFYKELMEQEEEKVADIDQWIKTAVPETARSEMQQAADLLQAKWPVFVRFQPEKPLPWIELTDEDLGLQVSVGERSVSINMPYFREDAGGMMNCIRSCLEVLCSKLEYTAYDPQLGRVVTAADFKEMISAYRRVASVLPQLMPSVANKKPWWKFW